MSKWRFFTNRSNASRNCSVTLPPWRRVLANVCRETGHAGAAARLCFISSNLAGRSLARIVEEELIPVGIIDHQQPGAPGTVLDRNALGLEFRAQRVQRSDRGFARRWLDAEGNEHQPLANLLRPGVGQDKRAAQSVDLRDVRFAVLVVAPGARKAEPVNVKD